MAIDTNERRWILTHRAIFEWALLFEHESMEEAAAELHGVLETARRTGNPNPYRERWRSNPEWFRVRFVVAPARHSGLQRKVIRVLPPYRGWRLDPPPAMGPRAPRGLRAGTLRP